MWAVRGSIEAKVPVGYRPSLAETKLDCMGGGSFWACGKVRGGHELAIVALGLAVQLVQHIGHCNDCQQQFDADSKKQGEGAQLIVADVGRSVLLRCARG